MVDSIKPGLINTAATAADQLKKAASPQESKDSFSALLKESIDKVNTLQNEADKAIEGLAKGTVGNIHETMIAVEKANLSFNLMVQVRNKLLAAYEEIMRTQV